MPRSLTRRLLRHLFLVSLASCMLAVFSRGWDEWDEKNGKPEPETAPQQTPPAAEPARKRSHGRRMATTLSFSILFFAGLALSAGAGNTVRALLDDGTPAATGATGATGPTGLAGAKAAQATAQATAQAQAAPSAQALAKPATPASATAKPAATRVVVSNTPTATARAVRQAPSAAKRTVARVNKQSSRTQKAPAKRSAPLQPLDAEASLPGATVWLHGPAVDPTPPAARLRIQFARELVSYSRQAGVDWALVLAVLRADGNNGRSPASRSELRSLSLRLARYGGRANGWAAALSV
jgi:hypothetical protein